MMRLLSLIIAVVLLAKVSITHAQDVVVPLYQGPIPNSNSTVISEKIMKQDITRIGSVQVPDIAVYLPSKRSATGQAVIICPGGGYHYLAYDWEGSDIARYLNSIGVAAMVLKYRLPVYGNVVESYKVPLMDAQRAMRLVRFNAAQWNISPYKIGIMGFSAGGHLASTLGTHFDQGNPAATDSVERMSCRPDFMILTYPVISFADSITHQGSREALIGKDPDGKMTSFYSSELQVTKDTPPAFLVHSGDDQAVPVENSLLMYQALLAQNIPAEMHIFPEGGHGFGLNIGNEQVNSWANSLRLWLTWLNKQ